MKIYLFLFLLFVNLFASGDNVSSEIPDLTMTWVGFATLFIFAAGYYWSTYKICVDYCYRILCICCSVVDSISVFWYWNIKTKTKIN